MRDILSKVLAGSMIAGAALTVAACNGGSENNTAANDLGTDVYNEVPVDNGMGDYGNTGNTGTETNTSTNYTTTNTTTTNTTNDSYGNGQ